jgi:magnesium transporter
MPINILAGMGGMSEFSMMTEGVPWPIAYGGFVVAACVMGAATFFALKFFEKREGRQAARSGTRVSL